MADSRIGVLDDLVADDDPRLDEEFWRVCPAGDDSHPAVVVGVVHDHPASRYRVRTLARSLEPDLVGLELPGLVVPVFERAVDQTPDGSAANGRTDGTENGTVTAADGDEMRAAIAASPDATVVGIDTLGPGFFARLARNALRERASVGTVRRAGRTVVGMTRRAFSYRLGRRAVDARPTSADHGVGPADSPAEQATHERAHVERGRSLLDAIERPHADLLVDGTREGTMAGNVTALRRQGTVLAVVGLDHLDRVASQIE